MEAAAVAYVLAGPLEPVALPFPMLVCVVTTALGTANVTVDAPLCPQALHCCVSVVIGMKLRVVAVGQMVIVLLYVEVTRCAGLVLQMVK